MNFTFWTVRGYFFGNVHVVHFPAHNKKHAFLLYFFRFRLAFAGLFFVLVVVVGWLLSTTTSKALRFGLWLVFGHVWRLLSGCASNHKQLFLGPIGKSN